MQSSLHSYFMQEKSVQVNLFLWPKSICKHACHDTTEAKSILFLIHSLPQAFYWNFLMGSRKFPKVPSCNQGSPERMRQRKKMQSVVQPRNWTWTISSNYYPLLVNSNWHINYLHWRQQPGKIYKTMSPEKFSSPLPTHLPSVQKNTFTGWSVSEIQHKKANDWKRYLL